MIRINRTILGARSFGINLKQARSCGSRWASWGHAGAGQVQPGAIFMKFLYPAPLSSREFICGMRHTLIKLRAFSGEAGTGSPENALVGIFNDELRSRLRLRRHWRGGLCRHGALSERLRQLVR